MVVICEHRAMRLLLFGLDSSQTLLQRTTIFFLKVVRNNIYTGSVKLVTFQEICGETADLDTDRELFFSYLPLRRGRRVQRLSHALGLLP